MIFSILICCAGFFALLVLLRNSQVSLGLPVAYLGSLLLIHVPGAFAHVVDRFRFLPGREFTEIGIAFTAIATLCFVAGVGLAHFHATKPTPKPATRSAFWQFCLLAGWFCTSIGFLIKIPSIGAVLTRGGPIWMLGIMLGLRSAMKRGDGGSVRRWLVALTVYPALILLLGGFLSFGSMAVIIVLAGIAVIARSFGKVALAMGFLAVGGISVFLGYYENRNAIRAAVWGGQSTEARLSASMEAVRDISFFNPDNVRHLQALDERLNQNYFVGLAATRIENGRIDYLRGRSLWEGVLALVPRALWADKPVTAGSPKVVSEMTGLDLSPTTSFGVGNVMEFQINFGLPGLIIGFLLLGGILGRLDRLAAEADLKGDLPQMFLYFLPAVALIQPNGSLVEMSSGAAAGLAAAYGWKWLWGRWPKPSYRPAMVVRQRPAPLAS